MVPNLGRFIAACALACALGWPLESSAQSWDAFPELASGQHFRIKKRYDGPKYDDVRRCLRRFESKVGASYYGAIVDVTDPEGQRSREANDASEYADALATEWSERGLDSDQYILFVTGLRNRSLAVKTSENFAQLGLQGEQLQHAIETSDYTRLTRRRDYGQAFCELAEAIDQRLLALSFTREKEVEEAKENLTRLTDRYSELQTQTDTFDSTLEPVQGFAARLDDIETKLDGLDTRLDEDASNALTAVEEVDDALVVLGEEIGTYQKISSRLDELLDEAESVQKDIESRGDTSWRDPAAALAQIELCKDKIADARTQADDLSGELERCIADAKAHLPRADLRHFYLARAMPLAILGIIAASILIAIVLFRRRRSRALGILKPDLAALEAANLDASNILSRLAQENSAVLQATQNPWSGQSEELCTRANDALNRLHFLIQSARELHDSAAALRRGHPLDYVKPSKALKILRTTSLSLNSGTLPPSSPTSIPMQSSFSCESSHLLVELMTASDDAARLLDRYNAVWTQAVQQLKKVDDTLAQALHEIQARAELRLDNAHLLPLFEDLRHQWQSIRDATRRDPIRSSGDGQDAHLASIAEGAEAILERAMAGNQAVRAARHEFQDRIASLHQSASELQKARPLAEQGFDPDAQFETAQQLQSRIEALVVERREFEAAQVEANLREHLNELGSTLRSIAVGRQVMGPMLSAVENYREVLKGDVLKLRIALGKDGVDLREEHLQALTQTQGEFVRLASAMNRVERTSSNGAILEAMQQLTAVVDTLETGAQLVATLSEHYGVEVKSTPADLVWPDAWKG